MPLTHDLFAMAYRLMQDQDEAQDIVQDVLTKLWQIRSELPPEGADKAYCLTMVRNRCLDRLRQQQILPLRHPADENEDENKWEEIPNENSDYEAMEAQDYLDNLLEQLPPRARQIVELRLRDGFSFREIEQLTGISEGNARVILTRTLKRLRDEHQRD